MIEIVMWPLASHQKCRILTVANQSTLTGPTQMTHTFGTEPQRHGWAYKIYNDNSDNHVGFAGGFRSLAEAELEADAVCKRLDNASKATLPPAAEDLELASAGFDTATMRLLASATAAHLADSELGELEQCLRDHAHSLLRTADVLAARRLRARGAALRIAK